MSTRTPRCCRRPEVRASLHLPDDVGREQAWLGMAAWLGQWELRGTGQWAVEEHATGEFVGRAGMHFPERADWPGIEIGWAFHPDHWGSGLRDRSGPSRRRVRVRAPRRRRALQRDPPRERALAGRCAAARLHAVRDAGRTAFSRVTARDLAPRTQPLNPGLRACATVRLSSRLRCRGTRRPTAARGARRSRS